MFRGSLEVQYASSLARSSLVASIVCNAGYATLWCITGILDAIRLAGALHGDSPR